MTNNPRSFHTFLFPFRYSKCGESGKVEKASNTYKEFCEALESEPSNWSKGGKNYFQGSGRHANTTPDDEIKWQYGVEKYFNSATRKALGLESKTTSTTCNTSGKTDLSRMKPPCLSFFTRNASGETDPTHHPICNNYYFTKQNLTYHIVKDDKRYELPIHMIRLHVFNTGVAVLRIEAEYTPSRHPICFLPMPLPMPELSLSPSLKDFLDDVRKINEYGRRLFLPFLTDIKTIKNADSTQVPEPCVEYGTPLCADRLTITSSEKQVKIAEIILQPRRYKELPKEDVLLRQLLFQTKTGEEETNWEFAAAIDDRMFVCCVISDSRLKEKYMAYDKKAYKYKYETNTDVAKELYGLLNIDESGSSSQHRRYVTEELNKQIYPRWMDYGTLHAVTPHSFMILTRNYSDVEQPVIIPFLTQYVSLATLCIAQRASLIRFDVTLTEIASRFDNSGTENYAEEIRLEAETFARFQGELILEEVTPQIQGIELYDKLQEALYIKKLNEGAQRQLSSLFEIAEVHSNADMVNIGNKLGVLAGLIGVFALLFEFGNQFPERGTVSANLNPSITGLYILFMTTAVFAFIYFAVNMHKEWSRKKKAALVALFIIVVAIVIYALFSVSSEYIPAAAFFAPPIIFFAMYAAHRWYQHHATKLVRKKPSRQKQNPSPQARQ